MIDLNQKVPISTLTTTFTRYAKRATTNVEKKYLYELVEAVGTAILADHPGFTQKDFMEACGVSQEWGKIAA